MKPKSLAQLVALLALGTAYSSSASPFRVDEPVPRLRLPSLAGGSALSLADFRGKKLMLHVWASW